MSLDIAGPIGLFLLTKGDYNTCVNERNLAFQNLMDDLPRACQTNRDNTEAAADETHEECSVDCTTPPPVIEEPETGGTATDEVIEEGIQEVGGGSIPEPEVPDVPPESSEPESGDDTEEEEESEEDPEDDCASGETYYPNRGCVEDDEDGEDED